MLRTLNPIGVMKISRSGPLSPDVLSLTLFLSSLSKNSEGSSERMNAAASPT